MSTYKLKNFDARSSKAQSNSSEFDLFNLPFFLKRNDTIDDFEFFSNLSNILFPQPATSLTNASSTLPAQYMPTIGPPQSQQNQTIYQKADVFDDFLNLESIQNSNYNFESNKVAFSTNKIKKFMSKVPEPIHKVTKNPNQKLKQHDTVSTDELPRTRGRKPSLVDDGTKKFACQYCHRRFRRQEHMKRHIRSLHIAEKPYSCQICSKAFSRNDNLKQHRKTHKMP
ncbi:hypothetical protein KAFR_0C02980 [Kazachstania africana CBS 2517]|uniref:C2H2-type domain-containing protein n=1 Tax=Kazachstania africana (strain ATCC 22294 / BCRC 22015 / CBS 2517 / CECT 1963 / NBRC 1671 / NRRL Y-8276) TaxID=1071382 RepID=H2ASE1_KAZAF|nr:hypothetical protein KAFR_0C02980 [Kazachstania africana CBS 2517]CCF57291.1 hypothetical protein KAFR_0C02980 [Kazachstania africana CBS 2517]